MTNRIKALVAATLIMLGLGIALAPSPAFATTPIMTNGTPGQYITFFSAYAAKSVADCPSNHAICLWDANNFGNTGKGMFQWQDTDIYYSNPTHCLDLAGTKADNMASSYADTSTGSPHQNEVYVSAACSGLVRAYNVPLGDANLNDNLVLPIGLNNSITSIEIEQSQ